MGGLSRVHTQLKTFLEPDFLPAIPGRPLANPSGCRELEQQAGSEYALAWGQDARYASPTWLLMLGGLNMGTQVELWF